MQVLKWLRGDLEVVVLNKPWGISCPTDKGYPLILDIALTTAGKGMMRWHERENTYAK